MLSKLAAYYRPLSQSACRHALHLAPISSIKEFPPALLSMDRRASFVKKIKQI